MTAPAQQLLAVAADGARWDIGDYRIRESTEAGLLLYSRRALRLAVDAAGRPLGGVTRYLEWTGDSYQPSSGSAVLTVQGLEPEDPLLLPALREAWNREILAGDDAAVGPRFHEAPRYAPLPVRDVAVTVQVDPADGAAGEGDRGSTVLVDLTATGSGAWAAAVTGGGPVRGSVRLAYTYPQVLPEVTALVQLHGRRLYAALAAALHVAADGEVTGTAEEIRAAWEQAVNEGAVEVTVSGAPAESRTAALRDLAEEARENLFGSLFVPRPATATYAFRWKRPADAPDLPLTVSVDGWTWLSDSLEAPLGELLADLGPGALHDVHPSVSVPVEVRVAACELVGSVGVSLDFGDVRPPEALLFDATGGVRTVTVTTDRPERLAVRHRSRVDFGQPSWPVVTADGTAGPPRPVVAVDAHAWLRRHEVHLCPVRGGRRAPDAWGPGDRATVTVRYESPALPGAVTVAAEASPAAPAALTHPVVPDGPPGRCTVTVLACVADQLLSGSADLEPSDDPVFVLVGDASVRILTGSSVLPEADRLGQLLRTAGARPVVRHDPLPRPEGGRDLHVSLDVPLVAQPGTVSGWAAALAMLLSGRDDAPRTPAAVAAAAGLDLAVAYAWPSIRSATARWGLVHDPARGLPPEEWADVLRARGPVWAVDTTAPQHGVVVCGVVGDGTAAGTWLRVHDPWPPRAGTVRHLPFTQLTARLGLRAATTFVHG